MLEASFMPANCCTSTIHMLSPCIELVSMYTFRTTFDSVVLENDAACCGIGHNDCRSTHLV